MGNRTFFGAVSYLFSFSAEAAVAYKSSADAQADMTACRSQFDSADTCVKDAAGKQESLYKEKAELESKNEALEIKYKTLAGERDQAITELEQGMYCDKCHRSASEIKRQEGQEFYDHLSNVNGQPEPAPPGLIEQKKKEYQDKLDALASEYRSNQDRILKIVTQALQERNRQLGCESARGAAREGWFRAQQWYIRLVALERENKLKESMLPKPLEAKKFGLGKNMRNSEYFVQRAYLKDGRVITLGEGVNVPLDQIDHVATHRGVDFSSKEDGQVKPMPFTAGVTGKAWAVPDSNYNTINVRDKETGNIIQFLHASKVSSQIAKCSEEKPCSVWSGSQLGTTGSTGVNAVHLHVQVRDANGNFIDPDNAFLPKNSPFYGIEADIQQQLMK